MSRLPRRVLVVALLSGLAVLPTLVDRMEAPANYGAHSLTTGFGRGRLDLQGIVTERSGHIDLARGTRTVTLRVSGPAPVVLSTERAEHTVPATEMPVAVQIHLADGGRVKVESAARVRLHGIVVERGPRSALEIGAMSVLGLLAVALSLRGTIYAIGAAVALPVALFALTAGTFSAMVARLGLVQLLPAALVATVFVPLLLAWRHARFTGLWPLSPLVRFAFVAAGAMAGAQIFFFEPPIPLGDPGAYLEMGRRFADAMAGARSPFGLGPILSDLQAYLALPATGLLYGLLLLVGGLNLVYTVQVVSMAVAVAAIVAVCEVEIGPRAARVCLALALIHPSFSVLPGIVQPEPFILGAWTTAAMVGLRALRERDPRGVLGASLLIGVGLSLHPQGLSFLLLALGLCLLPWVGGLVRQPRLLAALGLGIAVVLLPISAAEHFSKPMAHVLDKQFGFFAYTSPHPLGFWLYVDSDGWQGPLRIEDTTYQKELFALKGEAAVSSTFADVARFVLRHPAESAQTVLTNLHRLWHQPDNPFAVPFPLPVPVQAGLHRALVVLFVLSLPLLFGSRLALLALPFVMLSMTYPAYHIFNKYATPALPFTIIGAALVIDRLWTEWGRRRSLWAGLGVAALGALLPAVWFARLGFSGDFFLAAMRGLLWMGLGVALASAIRAWAVDIRSRLLAGLVGLVVLLGSSVAASLTDTTRGAWSASLAEPIEVSCRVPAAPALTDPAWLLIDARSPDGNAPSVEINGVLLETPIPTMPTYGLATVRGRRDPVTFRQLWRAPVPEPLMGAGELRIRVSGGPEILMFGDVREGSAGPRLSLGQWPYLSVYRLMHEGQYRLPTQAPAQACRIEGLSGRPGVMLARIPAGEEGRIALKAAKTLTWIF